MQDLIRQRYFYLQDRSDAHRRVYDKPVFHFTAKEVIFLASVNLRSNESQDSLLKRFRKKVVKSGVLSTIRRKRWFVSKSEQRRMDKKKAIRRIKRRQYTHDYE